MALVVAAAAVEVPVASPAAAGGAVAVEASVGHEAAAASPAVVVVAASPVVAAAVVAGSAARVVSPGAGGAAAAVAGGAGKAVLHVFFEQMIWGERGAFRAVLEQLLPKTVPAFSAVTAKITELSGKLDRRLEGFGIFFLLYSCFEGDWCTCRDVEKISPLESLESHPSPDWARQCFYFRSLPRSL